jgi:indolepyruvate ferredoxin oxidoreductase alpha subunit
VTWIRTIDAYNVEELIGLLKEARGYTQEIDGGIAVIVARHPCLIQYPEALREISIRVEITEECNGCRYCLDYFECPALRMNEEMERVEIDRKYCVDCGVCINVCPRGAIVESD